MHLLCLRCTFAGRLVTSPYVYDEFVTCHDLTQCPLRRSSSSVVNDNGPPEVVRQRHLSTNVHFRSNLANAVNWNAAAEIDQWQTTTARTGNEWAEPSSTRPEVAKRKRCRSFAYDLDDCDELSADYTNRALSIPGHTRPSAVVTCDDGGDARHVKGGVKDRRVPWRPTPDDDDDDDGRAAQSLDRGATVKKHTRFLLTECDARDTPV